MSISLKYSIPIALCIFLPLASGCSPPKPPTETVAEKKPEKNVVSEPASKANSSADPVPEKKKTSEEMLPAITFGGGASKPASSSTSDQKNRSKVASSEVEEIISHLKELQILLGTWRGITKKAYGGFKAVDQTNWVWDFRSNPKQPALVMSSSKSPYYHQARMTFLPERNQYQLTITDTEGEAKTYLGKFTVPIEDIQGDDKTSQRTYKLEFTQTDPVQEKATRFVFNQKNNNRYLLEYYRQRGSDDRFFRVDTVSTQREGTSFALIDEGYGKKTCIISGGLGTTTVSHKGTTYYVCCSGCKAAFEEDPEKWIARAEKQKMKK